VAIKGLQVLVDLIKIEEPIDVTKKMILRDCDVPEKSRKTRCSGLAVIHPSWASILIADDTKVLSHLLEGSGEFFNRIDQ